MSDVDLTVYPALRSGRVVTDLATTINSANTYYFRNNGKMLLHVNNTIDGLAITDKTATLATAKAAVFGPFPPGVYNNGDGELKVTFTQNVTVTVIQV